ncbi:uncharacterized protein LOC135836938 [Planococcus citri]|uniref:uncharacterized protein LOC135836938 n=1 Tax=Planococcus citri TaxID=170843 RepID=UPI0031F82692
MHRFLIFWLDDPDESRMHSFVFQFWEFKLMNIAILKKNPNTSFDIYTYDPYTESNCNRPGPLDLLDTWNSTHRYFRLNSDLFPLTKKLKNLHGCELVCFAKTRPPDAIVKEIGNNTWELDGIGGQLMEEVRKRINFTPVIQVPKLNVSVDKYGYDISYGYPELITELLNNFTVDLGFGIYSHIIYDNPRVEFSTIAVSECYGWAVPAHSGRFYCHQFEIIYLSNQASRIIPVWMYYTNEFSFVVWILILLVFSSTVVVFHLMIKIYFVSSPVLQTIDYVFLYVISLHLGISASPKIKFLKIRIWISAIILYSLIISSAYQSSLGSFLTVPWQRENIKTFQEILSANYNIIGVPQGKRILQRFSADNYVLKTLSNYFQVHREHFDSVVLRIHRKKDTATFGAQSYFRFVQFYISNELNGSNRDDIYLLPKCVIQAHASPFLHKKGSPFIKPIDNIISSAVESGLTNFWFKYSTPKIIRTLAEIFPLSLQQLKLAFAILVVELSK